MPARIYTRRGDAGETGLFGGQRVRKDDLRVEACGAVDELNSLLGVASAHTEDPDFTRLFARLQSDLFALGADLATPAEAGKQHGRVTIARVGPERAATLETEIDRLEAELEPLTRFILPGGALPAAALHLARAVCRRAERRCVSLARAAAINPEIVRYLNRLSDLLFVMARAANRRHGVPDVTWEP